jgi:hypothetical protein
VDTASQHRMQGHRLGGGDDWTDLPTSGAVFGQGTQCTERALFHDGMMSPTGVAKTSCNNPP